MSENPSAENVQISPVQHKRLSSVAIDTHVISSPSKKLTPSERRTPATAQAQVIIPPLPLVVTTRQAMKKVDSTSGPERIEIFCGPHVNDTVHPGNALFMQMIDAGVLKSFSNATSSKAQQQVVRTVLQKVQTTSKAKEISLLLLTSSDVVGVVNRKKLRLSQAYPYLIAKIEAEAGNLNGLRASHKHYYSQLTECQREKVTSLSKLADDDVAGAVEIIEIPPFPLPDPSNQKPKRRYNSFWRQPHGSVSAAEFPGLDAWENATPEDCAISSLERNMSGLSLPEGDVSVPPEKRGNGSSHCLAPKNHLGPVLVRGDAVEGSKRADPSEQFMGGGISTAGFGGDFVVPLPGSGVLRASSSGSVASLLMRAASMGSRDMNSFIG